jgi:thioesterase domain-containing protein
MLVNGEAEVRAAVHRAWDEVMPGATLDEGLTWQEAGVDSLKSLHLLLSVETALARPVSFDLLTRETRISELIAILAGKTQTPRPAPRRAYLVAGAFRIELHLAELRAALRDDIAFETLRDPELSDPIDVSADMGALGTFYAEQVRQTAKNGPLILAGYSFGAYAAVATALELQAKGPAVDLLCLLDPLPGRLTPGKRPLSAWPRLVKAAFSLPPSTLMVRTLLLLGWIAAARRVALMSASTRDAAGIWDRRRLVLGRLGRMALRTWRPTPYRGRVILFATDDFERAGDTRPFFDLLPGVAVVHVGGRHLEMFERAPLQTIVETLRRVFEEQPAA